MAEPLDYRNPLSKPTPEPARPAEVIQAAIPAEFDVVLTRSNDHAAVRAIENELRHRGGYALLSERDVKTSSGLSGKELRFGHDEGQKPHEYIVTVFVTDKRLYLLEAGGTEELVKKNKPQLDEYVTGFRVD